MSDFRARKQLRLHVRGFAEKIQLRTDFRPRQAPFSAYEAAGENDDTTYQSNLPATEMMVRETFPLSRRQPGALNGRTRQSKSKSRRQFSQT